MGISAEFAKLGARLVNNQWAVSALTGTELVASLWFHRLKSENGQLVYRDYLGRWSGHGNRLFAQHLEVAKSDQRPVRLVIARTDDVALIEAGGDGSKAKKTFKARPEWVGRVTDYDGDRFTIAFDKVS
ncbi:hypothetical protein [Thermomonas mangrovi]|jgi:putative restriction endonuclease|uniref:hypothetical protein n=1 Tax=Thermomonas mangrovi TaxID=2993316 RepID=UPI002307A9EF|nr:hypothetical protein [Thermomonas mangrovi]